MLGLAADEALELAASERFEALLLTVRATRSPADLADASPLLEIARLMKDRGLHTDK